MRRLLAALLCALLAAPGSAGTFRAIGGGHAQAGLPFRYLGAPAPGWSRLSPGLLSPLPPALRAQAFPILNALSVSGVTPEAFKAASTEQRQEWLAWGENAARAELHLQARALSAALKPESVTPVLAGALYMLQGPYAAYLIQEDAELSRAAFKTAYQALSQDNQGRFHEALKRTANSLKGYEEPMTAIEAFAASLPMIPSQFMTPRVARLRAWEKDRQERLRTPPPPYHRGVLLGAKVLVLEAWFGVKGAFARRVYTPARDLFRWGMVHWGKLSRKYVSGREMDRHSLRWSVVEELHRQGDFRGAFGHPVHEGTLEAQSGVVFQADAKKEILAQKIRVGRDLQLAGETIPVKPLELSAMLGVSGMSFPQLTAASHLSLLYIHLKMAKEHGARFLVNTGEGGPTMQLAFLHGDKKALERFIVEWNVEHGQFARGSWKHAKVALMVNRLMRQRDALFSEFTTEDLARAQVAAQFGSALNGVRGADYRVDYDRLRTLGRDPFVAMVQYKLKQAAKRGGKVDAKKLDDIVSAIRDLERGKPGKSPELNPEMDSHGAIAQLVVATKIVTGKPVSLKFAVGDALDAYHLLKTLRDEGALPDHLQIEGRGEGFSPGSGNAPFFAASSLPVDPAVLVVDALLKKLGVRDQVYLEATGDNLLPADGLERLMMGADGISAARGWMAMGLGCAMVKACDNGGCPYGIASRNDTLVGLSLDARDIAPKGYKAAANWYQVFAQTLAEAGASDWRSIRRTHGLRSPRARVQQGARVVTLDWIYNREYIENLLRGPIEAGIMTTHEAVSLVLGR